MKLWLYQLIKEKMKTNMVGIIIIEKNEVLIKCSIMFLFILDSDDNKIVAKQVHKRKNEEKHG